jgi:hypothetical protein
MKILTILPRKGSMHADYREIIEAKTEMKLHPKEKNARSSGKIYGPQRQPSNLYKQKVEI